MIQLKELKSLIRNLEGVDDAISAIKQGHLNGTFTQSALDAMLGGLLQKKNNLLDRLKEYGIEAYA